MKTYTVRSTFDGNDSFEIEAENLLDAALDTCNELGKDISADSREYVMMNAAPELLSALRFLLADYVAIEGDKLTASSIPADMARAAIAKAEGRAE